MPERFPVPEDRIEHHGEDDDEDGDADPEDERVEVVHLARDGGDRRLQVVLAGRLGNPGDREGRGQDLEQEAHLGCVAHDASLDCVLYRVETLPRPRFPGARNNPRRAASPA